MDARTETETPAAATETARPAPPAKRSPVTRTRLFIGLGLVVVIVAVLVGGLDWLLVGSHHVKTDDAYVNADVADITPLVAGPVISAPATDTLPVKKGDVLVVIDPSDYRLATALAQAQAQLGQAQRQVQGYFASRDTQNAMTAAKVADVAHARAQLSSAQGGRRSPARTSRRRAALGQGRGVRRRTHRRPEPLPVRPVSAATAAQAAVAEAVANEAAAAGQARAADALVAGTDVGSNPAVALAQAKLQQAKVDLDRTVIRAPIDGVIAKNTVEVGQRSRRRRSADDGGADPQRLRRRQLQGGAAAPCARKARR